MTRPTRHHEAPVLCSPASLVRGAALTLLGRGRSKKKQKYKNKNAFGLRAVATVLPLYFGIWLAPASVSWAEIAVLTNGDFLKIRAFELREDKMRLELAGGGALTLDIERIERIIDDEVVADPEPELAEVEPARAFPLRWAEGQRARGPHAELLERVAADYAINPRLMAAMARAESNGDPSALSHKGARGLLQLMPATAQRFGIDPENLWDPLHNATASARYLDFLIERFDGELDLVLAGYNAGEGAVGRYGGVPPYKETRAYIARIRRFLDLDEDS